MPRSEAELRQRYADLLPGDGGNTLLPVVQTLDTGYTLLRAPAELRARIPRRPQPTAPSISVPAGGSFPAWEEPEQPHDVRWFDRVRVHRWKVRALVLGALAVLIMAVAAGGTLAGSTPPNPTSLGRPTNDLPTYNLAAGFHRIPTNVRVHGKPEFLFMGTLADFSTASVRWPLVKALAQFGTFSHVKAAAQSCPGAPDAPPGNSLSPVPGPHGREPCGPPTFDLLHAAYYSRYLSFTEKDLLDESLHPYVNRLSTVERAVYSRYAQIHFYGNEIDNIWGSVTGTSTYIASTRRLPLFLMGNQLQIGVLNVTSGDFALSWPAGSQPHLSYSLVPYASFDSVRSGLVHHAMPKSDNGAAYSPSLLFDLNTDANIFSAVICHVDGMQPRSVCRRPVLEKIIKHLK